MASKFQETEFVDSDFQAAKQELRTASSASKAALPQRPPSREEIESKGSDTQVRLAELKRIQEELERERATLEEARRRRIEYQTGREEMLHHLTRGEIGRASC